MRRFQNILYVTRATHDDAEALKQALSLARDNSAELLSSSSVRCFPDIPVSTQRGMKSPLPIALRCRSQTPRLR